MTAAREQIIQTTCSLMEEQGYHATGLNQIIKESGSPKGSLYYYFPGGKEELTAEALAYVGGQVAQRIQVSLAEVDDPAQAIQRFILLVAENVVASGYRAGGPITTVAMETASTSERLREECSRLYASWQQIVADKLKASGIDDERADSLAGVFVAGMEGGILLCRTFRSPQPLERFAEEFSRLVRL